MTGERWKGPSGAPNRARRYRLRAAAPVVAVAAMAACRENLSAPPTGVLGPDTSGPAVQLSPARDTTVDSTGTLLVYVNARDPSGIGSVLLVLDPARWQIDPLTPLDTLFEGFYPIALASYRHSTFRYYARASDVLGHQTVTDTVAVTVR